jgi:hypothetical protein
MKILTSTRGVLLVIRIEVRRFSGYKEGGTSILVILDYRWGSYACMFRILSRLWENEVISLQTESLDAYIRKY